MAKAAAADLIAMGFAAAQFGKPPDFAAGGGYLEDVIDGAAAEVIEAVGQTVYDAASGVVLARLAKAEKYLAAAELWTRRAAFLDADQSISRDDNAIAAQQASFLKLAERATTQAEWSLTQVSGVSMDGGFGQDVVESGPFPAVSA